jgi:Cu-Zn family superoxide dismutase
MATLTILLIAAGAPACTDEQAGVEGEASASSAPIVNEEVTAVARLQNAEGQPVGTATFTESANGVQIHGEFVNLPAGTHGVHIHEKAACEPPDFKSAGEHFRPEGNQHGFKNPEGPHGGDLPNFEVAADGKGTLETLAPNVRLREGAENSLLKAGGTALVVHAAADDYQTDPSGNSGDRIACGVIEKSVR